MRFRLLAVAFWAAAIMALANPSEAACVIPNTFSNGTVADANQVNSNFSTLKDCINNGTASLPAARYALGGPHACNPVSDYGADGTGVAVANVKINQCNGIQKNGQYVNTFLPGGTYRLTNSVILNNGQCLIGEPGLTVLTVSYDFDSAATGVILPSGGGVYGGSTIPCIRGVLIKFDQPADIGSRSNFATLAAGCGNNGKGCEYPPAINFTGAQRLDLDDITIANAWDCITGDGANAGDGNDRWGIIRCGAFHYGLNLSGIKDVIHIDGYYFWPFGMSPDNNANIFQDGTTLAATMAEIDGFDADLFFTINARVEINSASGWFHFKTLMLDSTNAMLKVTAAAWVKIASGYATGGPTVGTNCGIIENDSGSVSLNITNFQFVNGGIPLICNGGVMNISNSTLAGQTNSQPMVAQAGGSLVMTGNYIRPIATGPWAAAIVNVSGGSIIMTGNEYGDVQTSGSAVNLGIDSPKNIIIGNDFNGWTFAYAAQLNGTYWPNKLNSSGDTGSAYIRNGNVTTDIDANGAAAAAHLLARGYSNANLQTWLGIDTTGQNGVLQSYKQGTGVLPLYIQPLGGVVGFGGDIIAAFPTSCAGKATGTMWNNTGVLNVCP